MATITGLSQDTIIVDGRYNYVDIIGTGLAEKGLTAAICKPKAQTAKNAKADDKDKKSGKKDACICAPDTDYIDITQPGDDNLDDLVFHTSIRMVGPVAVGPRTIAIMKGGVCQAEFAVTLA